MRIISRIIVPFALVGMVACGGGDTGGDTNGSTSGGDDGGTTTDAVTMTDNAFQPTDLSVASGTTLTVTNDGAALHSFTVQDAIDEDVQPGAEATVDIALEAGDYDFICKYHPEMTGSMTVE